VDRPDVAGETVNYFVVTRNRPKLLRNCLSSLAAGHESRLSQLRGRIYVVDDSTYRGCRNSVSSICRRRYELPVSYLGQASYAELLDEIEGRTGFRAEFLKPLVGPLGQPGWNVHAARNFAWLFARIRLAETPVYCFLDDDVQLTLGTYLDHCFNPDALSIISDNFRLLHSPSPVALGSSFLGRQDVTLSRHLEASCRELLRSSPSRRRDLNHGFPLSVATRRGEIDSFDDIPSTGFLVTNYAAIASAHLCGFYNEDWLWARLLASESHAKIARLKPAALHIGPERAYSRATILFQEMGEIFYDALTDSLRQKPKEADVIRFARNHLDRTALKIAVEYHIGVLARRLRIISKAAAALDHSRNKRLALAKRSLRTCIAGIGDTIQRLNKGEYMRYLAPFHAYLDQIPVWRRIVLR
jgi:hypothetical protein